MRVMDIHIIMIVDIAMLAENSLALLCMDLPIYPKNGQKIETLR